MLGIHCFFSQPVQQGRDVSGVYKTYIPGKIFSNYALYTMLLSALQWKKTNGNIKMFAMLIQWCYEPYFLPDKETFDDSFLLKRK